MSDWHAKSKEEIFKEFETSEKGLSKEKIKFNSLKYGKNIIEKKKKFQAIKILWQEFNSFFIYILFAAMLISFFFHSYTDGFVILAVVLLNGLIGFAQQYKAEKAVSNLKNLLVLKTKVMREGILKEIPSSELVPGDLIVLEAGDKINADCRIIEVNNLKVNEAILTGESLPIIKIVEKISSKFNLPERKNMLYAGTQVVKGRAKAIVVSTGKTTEFGKIADTLQDIKPQKSPMQKNLDHFSKQLGLIVLVLVGIIFILNLFHDQDIVEMLMTAVTLAVGAIPEGLPAVLAIAFSIAANQLSKRNVIVRKLPAVESLGSVTVICSDKTGTITKEEMTVQKIFVNNQLLDKKSEGLFFKDKEINFVKNPELTKLIETSILCNSSRAEKNEGKLELIGDPTEKALLQTAIDLGFDKKSLTEKFPRIEKIEFDSHRKMMSVLRNHGKENILYVKGAPEKIISLSNYEMLNGKINKLTPLRRKELLKKLSELENEAYRLLGFAYKNLEKGKKISEEDLIFLGFEGMIDPPRDEVRGAVQQCKIAGIKVKMVTGDSLLTAKAISEQIGIKGKAISGTELEKMSDAMLMKEIDDIGIFARITPAQKLRITKILQENGEVVAITGDGVNDVLALKSADIGIAMGIRGTDVSRDVSEIVLIDDNFASIVEGVSYGRKTYNNIKKFVKYMLGVNFDTIVAVTMLTLMNLPLPILPLQILWKNLITDSFPALTLIFEEEPEVLQQKPRKEKSILNGIKLFIIFSGLANLAACLVSYFYAMNVGMGVEEMRTMFVTTGIIFELLFVFACKSSKPIIQTKNLFSNKWMNIAIGFGLVLHLALLYSPFAHVFGMVALELTDWFVILPSAIGSIIAFEIGKYIKYTLSKKRNKN